MADLTPQAFAAKWSKTELSERSSYTQHFLDLCEMLGAPKPAEVDPTGDFYTFEKGVKKTGGSGGKGFADVWRKGFFAFEYKGKHKDLTAAYSQLLLYREDLENPPLLVVTDTDRFEVHTNFTGTAKKIYTFNNEELGSSENQEALRVLEALFRNPGSLKPGQTREDVTEEVAVKFAILADGLRSRGEEPHRVAHFLMKLVFCLFAEDVDLLPEKMFTRLVEASVGSPERFPNRARELFRAMAGGGEVNWTSIRHFNGGLFADDDALELTREEIKGLAEAARQDWASVEPAIFGTLFERSLDPRKRAQLGAQYTGKEDILRIVNPVLMAPLRREWEGVLGEVEALMATEHPRSLSAKTKSVNRVLREAQGKLDVFAGKVRGTTVLDPACGSGNFLYVALNQLLDLEKEISVAAGKAGLGPFFPEVSPEQLFGIELEPYARELAQVSVWIGYLQWLNRNGFGSPDDPILGPMTNIVERDAVAERSDDGQPTDPLWPEADVIVGNPPYLGDKRMRSELGDEYVEDLRMLYQGRVPGGADLVCYWFEKARAQIEGGKAERAGLLATNGIRFGANRRVLERVKATGDLFMAWRDRPWVLDGAAVRVSIVGFDDGSEITRMLDGLPVERINADLTALVDVTEARPLPENKGICFLGMMKAGPFELDDETAKTMLRAPLNPNGQPNSDVVRPRLGGQDVVRRSRGGWIVDFADMPLEEASFYEAPFEYVRELVKPLRDASRDKHMRTFWWLHGRSRPALRAAVRDLERCVVTPEVSKHRVFDWMDTSVIPDHKLHVFARQDDYFFGVLQCRIHESWSLAQGNWMGKGNDPSYSSSRTFETFPLPWPPGTEPREDDPRVFGIAEAARNLDRTRRNWLNPEGASEAELKKRTLTNLYNARPTWLANAHAALDRVVYAAYGWPKEIGDEEILKNLLALNLQRST